MIDLYDFVSALNIASRPGDIINQSASGMASNVILQTWKVKKGQRFVNNFVLGEMGAGLPYSIGAALATGRRVIHIEGDGGFQLNIQELETIRRLDLPVIMFIINNNGYHSIRQSQMKNFGRLTGADDTSGLTLPSLEKIAAAYEINYSSVVDFTYSVSSMVNNCPKPYLIEVFINPDQQYRHRIVRKFENGEWVNQ